MSSSGEGAAGMMAALFAAREGARVALVERNEKLGKKLYITGKGRCNLTNAADAETFQRRDLPQPALSVRVLRRDGQR